MVPKEGIHSTIEPVDLINQVLEDVWAQLSKHFDICGCVPELHELFAEVDLAHAEQAAHGVLVTMLQEVTERVGRFSPWYKRPARAYGLTSVRDRHSKQVQWVLAPEAMQQWQVELERLEEVIDRYGGLIQALVLVDGLTLDFGDEPCIMAQCSCFPPLVIQLRRNLLKNAEIVCQQCHQPFVEQYPLV